MTYDFLLQLDEKGTARKTSPQHSIYVVLVSTVITLLIGVGVSVRTALRQVHRKLYIRFDITREL